MNLSRREFLQGLGMLGAAAALPLSLTSSVLKRKYEVTTVAPGLKTYNIWPGVKDLMDPDTAKKVEAIKTDSTVYQFNSPIKGKDAWIRQINIVRYVGVTTDTIDEGIEKLAWILEDVDRKFGIKGNLAEAIAIPLFAGGFACVSYLLINDAPKTSSVILPAWNTVGRRWHDRFDKKWKDYKYSLQEGGVPIYEGKISDEEFKAHKKRLLDDMFARQRKKVATGKYAIAKVW